MRFEDFARLHGLVIEIAYPGDKIRRCGTEDHPRSDNGAYWFDGERGWVRVWDNDGETHWWNDPAAKPWGEAEKRAWAAKRQAEKQAEAVKYARGAERARQLLETAQPATHGYLHAKGLGEQQGLVTPDGDLLVPMWSFETGEIVNAQRIYWVPEALDEDGELVRAHWMKKTTFEADPKGAVFRIGPVRCAETWLCEGYATGLSIHAALTMLNLRASVLVTFSDHNMVRVAPRVPGRKLVFADHDPSGAGQRAAAKIGAPTAMSPVLDEDANDLHQRAGLAAVCREIMQARMQK